MNKSKERKKINQYVNSRTFSGTAFNQKETGSTEKLDYYERIRYGVEHPEIFQETKMGSLTAITKLTYEKK